ncbi:MAG: GNAT family N-acetyltransferase [Rhodobacteraceae bacterium]|nr:GNAT family N-acetyltransferase [Paracoccaceae bacterium]
MKIEKFDNARHNRSAFYCGIDPIDNFLKSSLSDQIKVGNVVAKVATADGGRDVLGFYTLGAMAVTAGPGPKRWQSTGVPYIPVIYIRAVAVHKNMQGKGYGTALMVDAMRCSLKVADQIGVAAIVLDVLRDDHFAQRRCFYEWPGFRPLKDPDNPERVHIPMADLREVWRSICGIAAFRMNQPRVPAGTGTSTHTHPVRDYNNPID